MRKTENVTSKMLLNAKMGSMSIQDCIGMKFVVKGIALTQTKDIEKGEVKDSGYIFVDDDKKCLATISPTVIEMLNDFLDMMEEGILQEGFEIIVNTKKNKSGTRDYIYLEVI